MQPPLCFLIHYMLTFILCYNRKIELLSGRLSLGEKSKQMRVDMQLSAHEPNRTVIASVFATFQILWQ